MASSPTARDLRRMRPALRDWPSLSRSTTKTMSSAQALYNSRCRRTDSFFLISNSATHHPIPFPGQQPEPEGGSGPCRGGRR